MTTPDREDPITNRVLRSMVEDRDTMIAKLEKALVKCQKLLLAEKKKGKK